MRVFRRLTNGLFAASMLLIGGFSLPLTSGSASQATVKCAVTIPNGVDTGESQPDPTGFGNAQMAVLGLWSEGIVLFKPGGPGFVDRDGSLGMQFGWRRSVPGRLTIAGQRLDTSAPPPRPDVPTGHGDRA